MAFPRLSGLPRSCKKYLLFLGFVLLLIFEWNSLRRTPRDLFRKTESKFPTSGISPAWSGRRKHSRSQRHWGEINAFNGLIRINTDQVSQYDMKKNTHKEGQGEMDEKAMKTGEISRRIQELEGNRNSETARILTSDIKPSIGLAVKKSVHNDGNLGKLLNASKSVSRLGTAISNNTRQRFKPSEDSHNGESKTFKNSVERSLNISHGKKHKLLPAKDQFKNFKDESDNKNKMLVEGYLNMHTWNDICSASLDSLRNFLLFPIAPNSWNYTSTINVTLGRMNSGQRLFGYLSPPASGNFSFSIRSRGNAELWLSTDKTRGKLRVIARKISEGTFPGTNPEIFKESNRNISTSVELKSGEFYYIEILHKHGEARNGYLEVLWKNSVASMFSPIQSSSLIAIRDSSIKSERYQYRDILIKSFARDDIMLSGQASDESSNSKSLSIEGSMVMKDELNDVLPVCKYRPSYLVRHKLVRFQGARNKNNTSFVKIFPPDNSNESLAIVEGEWWKENAIGNKILDKRTAMNISKTFMISLERKHARKYTLEKILSIRSTEDIRKGTRFFLNLKLQERATNSTKFVASYVYRKKGETTLCFPEHFRWNPHAMVHVVVPVKDSSAWVLALVKNIEDILKSTNDQEINIVIVDYESQDLDIKQLLQESSIKNFQVVNLQRNLAFHRAEALQKAADAVNDPNGILFLCDLHLSMPKDLFLLIRQHCVQGKMAFAPVVKRLRCGYYPSNPYGYWETLGFGLFAIYKSDFDRIGGMDVQTFKQWGGEDWELLDRVLMSGMEVERRKVPAFYHFYHKPLGSFNQRNDT